MVRIVAVSYPNRCCNSCFMPVVIMKGTLAVVVEDGLSSSSCSSDAGAGVLLLFVTVLLLLL